MKPTILLVDDEPQIRRALKTPLAQHGYVVIEAKTGEEAIEKMGDESADLVVLDMNMPGMGGLAACQEIRERYDVPIIILSVRNAEKDKVAALDAGADDYVVKPVGIEELLARVRANLRRRPAEAADTDLSFTTKSLSVDFERREVLVRGKDVRLTPKEFDLLRELVSQQGKPVAHRELLQAVWGPDYGDQTEYLRVFINQLRKKIEEDPAKPKYILTEPWVGYRFQLAERSA
jgi:two-component system, OmpR family, KDP operon response regulator KdpE